MGAQGTASLNFGAAPGTDEAFVDVTGQTGFVVGSLAEAWLYPIDTADHTADEHRVAGLQVDAAYQADGTIRIFGRQVDADPLDGVFNVGWVWN
jgi:hypothetical protein